jgi:hypothetical protein
MLLGLPNGLSFIQNTNFQAHKMADTAVSGKIKIMYRFLSYKDLGKLCCCLRNVNEIE